MKKLSFLLLALILFSFTITQTRAVEITDKDPTEGNTILVNKDTVTKVISFKISITTEQKHTMRVNIKLSQTSVYMYSGDSEVVSTGTISIDLIDRYDFSKTNFNDGRNLFQVTITVYGYKAQTSAYYNSMAVYTFYVEFVQGEVPGQDDSEKFSVGSYDLLLWTFAMLIAIPIIRRKSNVY